MLRRMGRRTYPRYFKLEFAFRRVVYQIRSRIIDPTTAELQAHVVERRSQGGVSQLLQNISISGLELHGIRTGIKLKSLRVFILNNEMVLFILC